MDSSDKRRLDKAVRTLAARGDCEFRPSSGQPADLRKGANLPEDLRYFYQHHGGADLFDGADQTPLEVLSPEEFGLTVEKVFSPGFLKDENQPFMWWYAVAYDGGGLWISIDLHPERAGHCYLCYSEDFGAPGRTPIVARSFTELLERLAAHKGPDDFWEVPKFKPYGDAFDS